MARIQLSHASRLALLALLALVACAADPDPTASPVPSPVSSARPTVDASTSPPAGPTPAQEAGGAYLAIGDSITFGIGVPNPRSNGYVGRLSERLARGEPQLTETRVFAVPGETAVGFLERRLDDVVTAIDELGPRVELVTIGLGANELLRIRRDPLCEADPSSAACTAAASGAMTDAARALDGVVAGVQDALADAGSDARILVLAYYNPDVRPIATATLVGADAIVACDPDDAAPGLNDRIACVAEDRGVELVDLYAAFLGREEELTRIGDGDVHPNADGYEVIADAIAATLGRAP